jgi:polyphosphate kinase 2
MMSKHARKIIDYFEKEIPREVRDHIAGASGRDMVSVRYPYRKKMKRDEYEEALRQLQIQLVRLQADVVETGKRVVVILEGRDAAGKGGTIKRFCEHLNPRTAKTVALSAPSNHEAGLWYFQRYLAHLPTAGEIVFFDRSWYNRAVVENVFDFCSDKERELFFKQVPEVERAVTEDGIVFVKLWLTLGRTEQLRRMLARANDPLKQWKLSPIDVEGLERWDHYTTAIGEMFERTHVDHAPWTVIKSDCKRRARLSAIRAILGQIDYSGKNDRIVGEPDPLICGSPAIWDA